MRSAASFTSLATRYLGVRCHGRAPLIASASQSSGFRVISIEHNHSMPTDVRAKAQLKFCAFWTTIVPIGKSKIAPPYTFLPIPPPNTWISKWDHVGSQTFFTNQGCFLEICSCDCCAYVTAYRPRCVDCMVRHAAAQHQKSIITTCEAVCV